MTGRREQGERVQVTFPDGTAATGTVGEVKPAEFEVIYDERHPIGHNKGWFKSGAKEVDAEKVEAKKVEPVKTFAGK